MTEKECQERARFLTYKFGLSAAMFEVVEKMLQNGGRLHREPGGFWVYPGTPVRKEVAWGTDRTYKEYVWSARVRTLESLERRGLLMKDPNSDEFVLSPSILNDKEDACSG